MFDPQSEALIRSAPRFPNFDPSSLPQDIAQRYADLAARRLGRNMSESPDARAEWSLARIADAYELLATLTENPSIRRPAAFVSATAQQVLALENSHLVVLRTPLIDRDHVDPGVTAALLFLVAEQYADAADATRAIHTESQNEDAASVLVARIVALAQGRIGALLDSSDGVEPDGSGLEEQATQTLLWALASGVKEYARELAGLSAPGSARDIFSRVVAASTRRLGFDDPAVDARTITTYPGPLHAAKLLLAAYDATQSSSIQHLVPPAGGEKEQWSSWISSRASQFPWIWPNHKDALLVKEFYQPGRSAVVILPTGAGKSSLSSFKIQATIGAGKKVIYLAPTHALVEQVTEELTRTFPATASADFDNFDFLTPESETLGRIEVMTPERCLALLMMLPDAFSDVGLLVFDECHLLSVESGTRRSIDAMLCVIAFNSVVPEADLLLLSAMINNGEELSGWLSTLTGRSCSLIESRWKPTRQVRGVIVYMEEELKQLKTDALAVQAALDAEAGRHAKGLRAKVKSMLEVKPYALFGLEHNWLQPDAASCSINLLSTSPVRLTGELSESALRFTPNANTVAADISALAARSGLKTIVFVNVKSHAVSTAARISAALSDTEAINPSHDEQQLWSALEVELGGVGHSYLHGTMTAVPHNSAMLRIERLLAEASFRRPNGARVIVATPTLAQGLNLPAELAVLAGDKRSDPATGRRSLLASHELLNAAGRAGRAGHLANGMVLLVPEPIVSIQAQSIGEDSILKLKSLLPDDDRCMSVRDPLEHVLDRISEGAISDRDVSYVLNRFMTVSQIQEDSDTPSVFSLGRSLAHFAALAEGRESEFRSRVATFEMLLAERTISTDLQIVKNLAAQTGASLSTMLSLHEEVLRIEVLPDGIAGWADWTLRWLARDDAARADLIGADGRHLRTSLGRSAHGTLQPEDLLDLLPATLAWLRGDSIASIETALGTIPAQDDPCERARTFTSVVMQRVFSFVVGLVTSMATETLDLPPGPARTAAECAPVAVRKGFDTPQKLAYATTRKGTRWRRQIHLEFNSSAVRAFEGADDDDFRSLLRWFSTI